VGATLFYFSSYCVANGLIYWHQIFDEVDGEDVCRRRYRLMKLAHVPEVELRETAAAAGFEVESIFGWYDRRPAAADSNNLLCVLRKPGGGHEG